MERVKGFKDPEKSIFVTRNKMSVEITSAAPKDDKKFITQR